MYCIPSKYLHNRILFYYAGKQYSCFIISVLIIHLFTCRGCILQADDAASRTAWINAIQVNVLDY